MKYFLRFRVYRNVDDHYWTVPAFVIAFSYVNAASHFDAWNAGLRTGGHLHAYLEHITITPASGPEYLDLTDALAIAKLIEPLTRDIK